MHGVFEARADERIVRRETWSLKETKNGRSLSCEGRLTEGRGCTFKLNAQFGAGRGLESVDCQVALSPPPTEVTTSVFKVFGGRAYGTTIPPGGVPEKIETQADPSFAVRGFSTAMDGLIASHADLRVGHARRMVVALLETADLRPRLRDGILLCKSRTRERTPTGEEWCHSYEFRWAEGAARPEAVLVVARGGLVVRAEHPSKSPAAVTRLVELAP